MDSKTPKLIYSDDTCAIIECPYVPLNSQNQIADATRIRETICCFCGFKKDADLKAQDRKLKFGEKEDYPLSCFNPASVYLPAIKKELREKGVIK